MDSILLKREMRKLAAQLDSATEATLAELVENIKEVAKWEKKIKKNDYNHLSHSLQPMLASRRAKVEMWVRTWDEVMNEKRQKTEY